MKDSLNTAKYVFIALAVMLVLAGYLAKQGKLGGPGAKIDPFEGDFEMFQLQPTDPALIGYNEAKQLKVNLSNLTALAVGQDNLFVAGDSAIVILSEMGNEITSLSLKKPATCLAISPDNQLFVGSKNKIHILTQDRLQISEWLMLDSNAEITSLAVTDSDVFIADAGNRVVWRYTTKGELIGRIGERDLEKGHPGFIIPSPYFDVAIGHEGLLWAVNSGRLALENYNFDGKLRSSWEGTTTGIEGFCGCCNPSHMAILSDGSFVTSEKGIPRVKVYDQTGQFKTVVAGPEKFVDSTVGLDLAVDADDRIYVLDPKKKAVRVFTKKES